MSAGNLQHIAQRLREERTRLDLSQVAVADACGVNRGTVAAWEKGEQTPTAAVLATVDGLGMDVQYIVTGKRPRAAAAFEPGQVYRQALQERGIAWSPVGETKNAVEITPHGLLWLAHYTAETGALFNFGAQAVKSLAGYAPQAWRDLHLQVIQLHGWGDQKYPQLLAYLEQSPPRTPWSLSPSFGLHPRYELDTGLHDLPLKVTEATPVQPLLVLSNDVYSRLKSGHIVTIRHDQKNEPGKQSTAAHSSHRKAA